MCMYLTYYCAIHAVATVSMVMSDLSVGEGDGSVGIAVVISGAADGLECDVTAMVSLMGSSKAGIALVFGVVCHT